MNPRIATLRTEIAELEEEIAATSHPRTRVRLETQLNALRSELAALLESSEGTQPAAPLPPQVDQSGQSGGNSGGTGNSFSGPTQIGDRIGPQVGALGSGRDTFVATQQTIQIYYGAQPPPTAGTLLSDYLSHFAAECNHLRLQRISGKRQKGGEQAAVPELRLQAVYTSLTTDGPPVVRCSTRTTVERAERFLQRLEQVGRSPDDVQPERVITVAWNMPAEQGETGRPGGRPVRTLLGANELASLGLAATHELTLELQRPELAVEAIARNRRLVLLGEPGSGKSTVLRYLGYLLARRACGAERLPLVGWAADDTPIPVMIPLTQVAEQLTNSPNSDQALWQTLGTILDGPQGLSAGLRDSLRDALRRGGVMLLCDGLDELSAEGGEHSPRTLVSQALQRLAKGTKTRVVVTSRVLPYQSAESWQLPEDEGWHLRTLAPLALGQVRAFAHAWFRALVATDPDLTVESAHQVASDMIAQIEARRLALEPLVRTPLLLTMLTLLHRNADNQLPTNEVDLYEQCVELLLERWEPVRQPGFKRPGLIERLGNPKGLTLEVLRKPLHQLAYKAHHEARGEEGRGVISDEVLCGRLVDFFDRLELPDPLAAYKTLKRVLAEDAGLLVARGDDAFAFPHLSFQEYLAACFLADLAQKDMIERASTVWQGDDRERWRKALLLLSGRLVAQGKAMQGLFWLKRLWGNPKGGKAAGAYAQDVRLAALVYHGMGGRTAFAASELDDLEAEIEIPLRNALTTLFATRQAAVPAADRLIAGRVLGELSDPRYPVNHDEWGRSLARLSTVLTDQGAHYWRYVPAGSYRIGGWEEGEASVEHALPPFWIARLPLTVAQFARFVAEGYGEDRFWTPHGLAWRDERSEPYRWGNPRFSEPNQPVVNVTWYEATACCHWLTSELETALPVGHTMRLPTEAEWEAAAAFGGPGERRDYPWGPEEPTPERAVYDAWDLAAPAPVGLCPAGVAACGALDLAGTVWEWTSSRYRGYPNGAATIEADIAADDWDVPIRGGTWWNSSTNVRCGARYWNLPDDRINNRGVRVVVSPLARTNVLNTES